MKNKSVINNKYCFKFMITGVDGFLVIAWKKPLAPRR